MYIFSTNILLKFTKRIHFLRYQNFRYRLSRVEIWVAYWISTKQSKLQSRRNLTHGADLLVTGPEWKADIYDAKANLVAGSVFCRSTWNFGQSNSILNKYKWRDADEVQTDKEL